MSTFRLYLLLCLTVLVVSGCASTHVPGLTSDHPADSRAEPGCVYNYPTVLSIKDPVPRPTPMEMKDRGMSGKEAMQ